MEFGDGLINIFWLSNL